MFFCVFLKLSSFPSITLLDDLMPNQWWGWRLWSRYWNPFPNQFFSNGIFSVTKRLFPKTILRMNTTLSLYLNISFPFCCIRYIIINYSLIIIFFINLVFCVIHMNFLLFRTMLRLFAFALYRKINEIVKNHIYHLIFITNLHCVCVYVCPKNWVLGISSRQRSYLIWYLSFPLGRTLLPSQHGALRATLGELLLKLDFLKETVFKNLGYAAVIMYFKFVWPKNIVMMKC